MKVLLDTSVLVAGLIPSHPRHAVAQPWLDGAKRGTLELVISSHSIAELYAVLTRMPARPRISGPIAVQLIADILTAAQTVVLSGSDYQDVITSLAQNGLVGGVVYDAVIARAAELENVDHLLTLNEVDFQRIWPSGAARIASPQTLPPPTDSP